MKKKLLIAMIPVLGMGALVGSGFSAWVFGNGASQTYDFAGSISVTTATSGNLTFNEVETSNFAIKLDQGGKENAADATKGITVTSLADLTFTLTTAEDVVMGANPTHEVLFTYSITSTIGNYSKYLTYTTAMSNVVNSSSTSTPLSLDDGSLNSYMSYEYADGVWTFTLNMPDPSTEAILNYAERDDESSVIGKPQSYQEWTDMNTALNGESLGITISASAVVVAKA